MKHDFEIPADSFIAFAVNAGHRILFHTVLFGKDYMWMQDIDGTIYLERMEKPYPKEESRNA